MATLHGDLPGKQTRIFLWHWPRSISTCLEKCMSFVDGVQVWHEPYQVPFSATVLPRMMAGSESDEHLASLVQGFAAAMMAVRAEQNEFSGGNLEPVQADVTYPWVKSELEKEDPGKKYIFVKDCAFAIYDHQDALPDVPSRHTFIIRHPARCITSERNIFMRIGGYKGNPADYVFPSEMDRNYFNIDYMHLLWKSVQESGKDPNPIIIDAGDLMNHPEVILSKYLGALGIPYRKSYTTWDASEESIKTWKGSLDYLAFGKRTGFFDKAFASSRFLPSTHVTPREEDLTPDIKGIIDRLMPGYLEMYEQRIRPE